MKIKNTSLVLFCCCVLTSVINHSTGDSVMCIACTYTFAGDGTTGIECVTDGDNYKDTAVNCTSGRCETRAVYTMDYQRLNSLYRGCLYDGISISEKCDPPSEVYPTCELSCSTPTCNNRTGDIWSYYKTHDDKHNWGVNLVSNVNFYLIITLVLFVLCCS